MRGTALDEKEQRARASGDETTEELVFGEEFIG